MYSTQESFEYLDVRPTVLRDGTDDWTWRNPLNLLPLGLIVLIAAAALALIM
jgi:hypothetical protein